MTTLRTLSFAAFLASSWTWCIGMFLPVLLVRDFGVWGFVIFAAPNVLGAAAMGFVLADPARAAAVRAAHRPAAVLFSVVTVCFQLVFVVWLSGALKQAYPVPAPPLWGAGSGAGGGGASGGGFAGMGVGMTIVMAMAVSAALSIALRKVGVRWLGVLVYALSAGAVVWAVLGGHLHFSPASWPSLASSSSPAPPITPPAWITPDLLLLAPVVAFGFAFCPYLDLTFLRAAMSQTPAGNRASFSLGFGVLFLAMIVFTLGYAWALMPIATGSVVSGPPPELLRIVWLHVLAQVAFTAYVHSVEVVRAVPPRRLAGVAGAGVIATLGLWLVLDRGLVPSLGGLSGGEVVYRLFMSFYGLVFPAYVWICMIPTRDGHSGLGGGEGVRKLVVLIIACALAAPCYWMGFIEREELWLAPGLAIVLLARVVAARGARPQSEPRR